MMCVFFVLWSCFFNFAYIQTKCINIYSVAVKMVINLYEYANKYSVYVVRYPIC